VAVSLAFVVVMNALFASSASANHSLISRTDGPWTYKYGIADTDGLILQEVKYNGKFVFGKFSLVQVEVEYIEDGETSVVLYDEMGHGSSTQTTLYPPYGALQRTIGGDGTVVLTQDFRYATWAPTNDCDYRYKLEYHLHPNGDIHPWVWVYGPGCLQSTHTGLYHFFFRADFDIRGGANDKFSHWHTTSWETPATEAANPHHDDGDNRFGQNSGPEWQTWEPTAPVSTYNFDPHTQDETELWLVQFDANTGGIGDDLPGQVQEDAWHFPSQWSSTESVQNVDITHWYVIHAERAPGYGNGSCWPSTPCLPGPDRFNPTGTW
jgi:hypothetical protein